jgi:para-aminobenzoate synthetase/4-amino-4-deoxychorismate lyase
MAAALHASEKNRAENVMIVDMVRNDMGRVADKGSVRVPNLFDIEKYPTLYQMTSTVTSATSASFAEIMKALFPCASITGAPKIRTMEIIRELEPDPRGIYTGCIGLLSPGRHAEFNVAIRTVWLDKTRKSAEYGVGGGIVWDSDAGNEYEECRVKTAVLTADTPDFDLIETMLWEPGSGYFLLDLHLERLRQSAEYFGFPVDLPSVRARVMLEADAHRNAAGAATPARVRLLLSEAGEVNLDWDPLPGTPRSGPRRVTLAGSAIDRKDRFLYHKTTRRQTYDEAKQDHPHCDDVLLWNSAGEVTESTIANIVVETGGKRITPPVECGLLPGVFRQWLLDHGEIEEGIIKVEDLRKAGRIFLVNSVRKWMDVQPA